jgi:hypothetical protein
MKKLLPVLVFLLFPLPALAAAVTADPAQEKAAVLAVVQKFFDAMVARDAGGIGETFLPGTQYALGVPTPDGYVTKLKTIETLIAEVQQDPQPWLERIWHPTVLIEDRIATVWARYDFHKGPKFSHNGTDCYTLLKTDAGWRIAGLVFTIEPGAKTEHPAGPPR